MKGENFVWKSNEGLFQRKADLLAKGSNELNRVELSVKVKTEKGGACDFGDGGGKKAQKQKLVFNVSRFQLGGLREASRQTYWAVRVLPCSRKR